MNEKRSAKFVVDEEDPGHWSNLTQWARLSQSEIMGKMSSGHRSAEGPKSNDSGKKGGDAVAVLPGSLSDNKKEYPGVARKQPAGLAGLSPDAAEPYNPSAAALDDVTEGLHDDYLEWKSEYGYSRKQSATKPMTMNDEDTEYGDYEEYEEAVDSHIKAYDKTDAQMQAYYKPASPRSYDEYERAVDAQMRAYDKMASSGPGAFAIRPSHGDQRIYSKGKQDMDDDAKNKDLYDAYKHSAAELEKTVVSKKHNADCMPNESGEDSDVEYGGYEDNHITGADLSLDGPGAFRVGGGDEEQATMSSYEMTASHPDLYAPSPVTAHVVDPGQEEQLVQERVDQAVEERLGKAAVAEVVHEQCSPQRRRRILIGVALLVVIALGIGLGVALKPVPPPEPPTEEELTELISSASSDGGAAMMTNSTPQNQAFEWLVNNNTRLGYYSDERILQRYALATFYHSTKGNNWTRNENWLDDGDECNRWSQPVGHLACSDDGAVVQLDMEQNNLQGLIPPEISLLSSLVLLNLKSNALSGTIPTEIAYFDALEAIHLYSNGLTGTVPTEIANMTNLLALEFAVSFLTGTIPTDVGKLTKLESLHFNANKLNGTIPLEISKLTNMKYLNLRSNLLTGVIPTVLGLMTRLEHLQLYDNLLNGTIPLEILELTNLIKLNIRTNQLTGGIPTSVGHMTSLKQLRAYENLLDGRLPDEIALLTKLTALNIRSNQLTGTIPTATGLLTDLEELRVHDNELVGTVPTELGYLTKLTSLNIGGNKLVGSIPNVIYNLTTMMESLKLGSNGLVATIPTTIGLMTSLMDYGIANIARLTGTIPSTIGLLTKLEGFEVQQNMLTGTIPSIIHEMTTLVEFAVYDNNLTGPFTCPDFIADCFISCDDGFNESCRSLP